MPARLPVTGPAELFVNVGPGGSFLFLGTDEGDPHIEVIPTYSPMYNDASGAVPFDYFYEGEEAVIAMNLSRWDEAVYRTLATRPAHAGGVPGVNRFGDVGTPEIMASRSFQAAVTFPYSVTGQNVAAGVPPGYRFFACELFGPDDMRVGTKVSVIQIIMRAMRVYINLAGTPLSFGSVPAATALAAGPGGFALYSIALPPGVTPAITS